MMKKNVLLGVLIASVVCLSMTFLSGCSKQAGLKSEAAMQEQAPAAQAAPEAVQAEKKAPSAVAKDDSAAKDRALREQALRDQEAREAAERAAREAAEKAAREKAAKEAAEKAKKDAAARQAAILKELEIPDVRFDFDKYNLTPGAQATLKAGAPAYMKYKDYKLVVEGHCDERGSVEYNLALGQKRADEAAKYLVDLGIEKDRIKTISYGKEMPLDPGHDEAAWEKNRRAHFVLFPPVK
jgi:peptidoglycan-associated lipoprotein